MTVALKCLFVVIFAFLRVHFAFALSASTLAAVFYSLMHLLLVDMVIPQPSRDFVFVCFVFYLSMPLINAILHF